MVKYICTNGNIYLSNLQIQSLHVFFCFIFFVKMHSSTIPSHLFAKVPQKPRPSPNVFVQIEECICRRMYLTKLQKQSLRAFVFFCFDPLISISPFCRSSTKATSLPRVFVAVHCNTTAGETQYQCQYQCNIKCVVTQYQIYT